MMDEKSTYLHKDHMYCVSILCILQSSYYLMFFYLHYTINLLNISVND